MEGEVRTFQSPELGHAEGGINAHTVKRTAGHVHFNGKVRRRMDSQVQFFYFSHRRLVGNPVASVGFNPALLALAAERRRSAAHNRQALLLGQDSHQHSEEIGRPIVLQERRHDLQHPPVVGHANARPLGERIYQPDVCLPVGVRYGNNAARGRTGTNGQAHVSASGVRSQELVYSLMSPDS